MAKTIRHSISPPRDPEVDLHTRDELEYYITLPDDYNADKKYPIVFCIPGFGDNSASDYQATKLRPYITDKYGVISVGVRYHHDLRVEKGVDVKIDKICEFYQLDSAYFQGISNFQNLLEVLFKLMHERRIARLDPLVSLWQEPHQRYSSFGLLPAIDHLEVLRDILERYPVDKKNIIAFGTSYGGYIALLLGKYAPHTFSSIIDNSGFCLTVMGEIFTNRADGAGVVYSHVIDGIRYEIPAAVETVWSDDETSDFYFSDSHRKIRNLLIKEHIVPSETSYFCFHSVRDNIVPILFKDKFCQEMMKYHSVCYNRIDETLLDGKLFKNLEHGMGASLRGMFDSCFSQCRKEAKSKDGTDFDIRSRHEFVCAGKIYGFEFSRAGLGVSIR